MIRITNDFANHNRNFGNKLFTYAIARIFAKELNLKLIIPNYSRIQRAGVLSDFPYGNIDGEEITHEENYICDQNLHDKGLEKSIEDSRNKGVFLDGYFLKYDYIKNYKNFIKEIYSDLVLQNDGENDVVIMLRDSNCDGDFKIENEYYLNILEKIKFNKLYVCFDHIHKHSSLLKLIENYNPILVDTNIIDVFKFITSKNTIIACQGTFSFWASFLSNANKIYWPITKKGPNSDDYLVNLKIDDDERFEMVYL